MIKTRQWIELYWQEITGIVKLVFILALGIQIYQIPYYLRSSQKIQYDSETTGQIESIEKIIGLDQTEEGAKVVIKGYDIAYRYEVNRKEFVNAEIIPRNSLKRKRRIELNKLTAGDCIEIKYKNDHPEKSMMNI